MNLTKQQAWLTIIGITESGSETLSMRARHAILTANLLYGSDRQLALISDQMSPLANRRRWGTPIQETIDNLISDATENTVILASGDPMCWGIGETITRQLNNDAFVIIPATSIITEITAKLHWPNAELTSISLCSQPLTKLNNYLQPGRRMVLLSANEKSPKLVADYLCDKGYGKSHITVLENLGTDEEKITPTTAEQLGAIKNIGVLNSLAITFLCDPTAPIQPVVPGLEDQSYDHDGQITKRAVRAITIANLAPTPNAHLWDIGTGAGSISIEWCRAAGGATATAIEKSQSRIDRAKENAENLGVTTTQFIVGEAPSCLTGLKSPDAIFIGGGLTTPDMIETSIGALNPGGRLVANAVTIEGEMKLIEAANTYGGNMNRIAISEPDEIGKFKAWRPHMPVTQWIYKNC